MSDTRTGFTDKYGIPIHVGSTVRYTVRAQVATRAAGRGVNSTASPVYAEREAVGVPFYRKEQVTNRLFD